MLFAVHSDCFCCITIPEGADPNISFFGKFGKFFENLASFTRQQSTFSLILHFGRFPFE